jgi:multiple sugar transport system permease protein
MLNTVEVAPRQTSWRDLTRQAVGPAGRRLEPYGFLSPTLVILLILMLWPIGTVIRYSAMNNVILEKSPVFVGFANYVGILTSSNFWVAVRNTAFFTSVSVLTHLVLGMVFALLLNSRLLGPFVKAVLQP